MPGRLPEEGVLELALEGETGFTESMKASGPCVCWVGAAWEEGSEANFLLFHPLLGVSSKSLLSLGLLSSAPASSLGRSKRLSQPIQHSLGVPSDLRILQVCFLQQFFSIYSVPGSKVKNRFRENIPYFSDETWGADSGRDLPEVPQLQIQCSGLSMPSVHNLKLV